MKGTDPAASGDAHPTVAALPLFPLGLVLFPGGRLPLKIFEQRYLTMTKTCLRDDAPFGVCLIRHGQEVGAPADHEGVGCTARIVHWDMPHPGLFHLVCVGERVFRVERSHAQPDQLVVGDIAWVRRTAGDIDTVHFDRCKQVLQTYLTRYGDGLFEGPAALDDPEWVSDRLAELLPLGARARQSLLEQPSAGERLTSLAHLLHPT